MWVTLTLLTLLADVATCNDLDRVALVGRYFVMQLPSSFCPCKTLVFYPSSTWLSCMSEGCAVHGIPLTEDVGTAVVHLYRDIDSTTAKDVSVSRWIRIHVHGVGVHSGESSCWPEIELIATMTFCPAVFASPDVRLRSLLRAAKALNIETSALEMFSPSQPPPGALLLSATAPAAATMSDQTTCPSTFSLHWKLACVKTLPDAKDVIDAAALTFGQDNATLGLYDAELHLAYWKLYAIGSLRLRRHRRTAFSAALQTPTPTRTLALSSRSADVPVTANSRFTEAWLHVSTTTHFPTHNWQTSEAQRVSASFGADHPLGSSASVRLHSLDDDRNSSSLMPAPTALSTVTSNSPDGALSTSGFVLPTREPTYLSASASNEDRLLSSTRHSWFATNSEIWPTPTSQFHSYLLGLSSDTLVATPSSSFVSHVTPASSDDTWCFQIECSANSVTSSSRGAATSSNSVLASWLTIESSTGWQWESECTNGPSLVVPGLTCSNVFPTLYLSKMQTLFTTASPAATALLTEWSEASASSVVDSRLSSSVKPHVISSSGAMSAGWTFGSSSTSSTSSTSLVRSSSITEELEWAGKSSGSDNREQLQTPSILPQLTFASFHSSMLGPSASCSVETTLSPHTSLTWAESITTATDSWHSTYHEIFGTEPSAVRTPAHSLAPPTSSYVMQSCILSNVECASLYVPHQSGSSDVARPTSLISEWIDPAPTTKRDMMIDHTDITDIVKTSNQQTSEPSRAPHYSTHTMSRSLVTVSYEDASHSISSMTPFTSFTTSAQPGYHSPDATDHPTTHDSSRTVPSVVVDVTIASLVKFSGTDVTGSSTDYSATAQVGSTAPKLSSLPLISDGHWTAAIATALLTSNNDSSTSLVDTMLSTSETLMQSSENLSGETPTTSFPTALSSSTDYYKNLTLVTPGSSDDFLLTSLETSRAFVDRTTLQARSELIVQGATYEGTDRATAISATLHSTGTRILRTSNAADDQSDGRSSTNVPDLMTMQNGSTIEPTLPLTPGDLTITRLQHMVTSEGTIPVTAPTLAAVANGSATTIMQTLMVLDNSDTTTKPGLTTPNGTSAKATPGLTSVINSSIAAAISEEATVPSRSFVSTASLGPTGDPIRSNLPDPSMTSNVFAANTVSVIPYTNVAASGAANATVSPEKGTRLTSYSSTTMKTSNMDTSRIAVWTTVLDQLLPMYASTAATTRGVLGSSDDSSSTTALHPVATTPGVSPGSSTMTNVSGVMAPGSTSARVPGLAETTNDSTLKTTPDFANTGSITAFSSATHGGAHAVVSGILATRDSFTSTAKPSLMASDHGSNGAALSSASNVTTVTGPQLISLGSVTAIPSDLAKVADDLTTAVLPGVTSAGLTVTFHNSASTIAPDLGALSHASNATWPFMSSVSSATVSHRKEHGLTTYSYSSNELSTVAATKVKEKSSSAMSVMPPRLVVPFPLVNVTVGVYFEFVVPEATFKDLLDGPTRNLVLGLEANASKVLPPDSWVQFDAAEQMIYGLPIQEILSSFNETYSISATNSHGLVTVNRFRFSFYPIGVLRSHTFTCTLDTNFTTFMGNISHVIHLAKAINLYFNCSNSCVAILAIKPGSTVVSWMDTTIAGPTCNVDLINARWASLNTSSFQKALYSREPELPNSVIAVSVTLEGVCERYGTHVAPFIESSDAAEAEQSFIFLVLLLGLLLLPVALLWLYYRRRCEGRLLLEDAASWDGSSRHTTSAIMHVGYLSPGRLRDCESSCVASDCPSQPCDRIPILSEAAVPAVSDDAVPSSACRTRVSSTPRDISGYTSSPPPYMLPPPYPYSWDDDFDA